jgi:hypothetical protein
VSCEEGPGVGAAKTVSATSNSGIWLGGGMDEAKRREVLQQVYRGTKAGVAPASITLFFRQEDSSSSSDIHATLPHSAPPSYQDLLRTPPLATSSGTLQTLSMETMVCNIIASEVGVSAETVVCTFSKVASIVTLHSQK